MRNMANVTQLETPGLGPRKTLLIMVTVVGCIAILWPKVFYPMMFGGGAQKQNLVKDHRGTACCDVVLDKDTFMNVTIAIQGQETYRKKLNLVTGEISLRQERPPHLRADTIHPAMRERGRAIPATHTVPIVERASAPPVVPRVVEGRPGPIPGMRPPMGAGSVHQAQPKGSNMGFIMPLYTVGIVAFFLYTIMKILFKKPIPNAPYGPARQDTAFRKEVFGQDNNGCVRRPEDGATKLGSNNQQVHDIRSCGHKHVNGDISSTSIYNNHPDADRQRRMNGDASSTTIANGSTTNTTKINNNIREYDHLMEIEMLRRKLEDTEKAMAKIISDMGCDPYKAKETSESTLPPQNGNISNGHAKHIDSSSEQPSSNLAESEKHIDDKKSHSDNLIHHEQQHMERHERKKRETSADRTVTVLGMEMTASCEDGRKWGRPATPVFTFAPSHPQHSTEIEDQPEPQSIFLEGCLPHESQILVADSETHTENVFDEDLNGTADEPAVVLSSKMTLSLINLSSAEETDEEQDLPHDKDSPVDEEDMEIINGEEKEDTEEEEEVEEEEEEEEDDE